MGFSAGAARNQGTVDMWWDVIGKHRVPEPIELAARKPSGYGAGAVETADERLAQELAERRAARAVAQNRQFTQPETTKPIGPNPVTAIAAKLEATRNKEAALKKQQEPALQKQHKRALQGVLAAEIEYEQTVAREKKKQKMAAEKQEKARKRERALGMSAAAGKRPMGVHPVEMPKFAGVKKLGMKKMTTWSKYKLPLTIPGVEGVDY